MGQEAIEALKKEGLSPKYHQVDITDHSSLERLRDFLKATYGGLDILVNNAGLAFKMDSTAPFSEQAEVTLNTNFFGTLDASKVLFPLLRPHARVVHVSSMACQFALPKCSKDLQERFTSKDIEMEELVKLMKQFVDSAKTGEFKTLGYPESSYGMSKLGVTVMGAIQQRELDRQGLDDVVLNTCCPGYVDTDLSSHKGKLTIDEGAATPVFCALLSPNIDSPKGQFIREQKVAEFKMK